MAKVERGERLVDSAVEQLFKALLDSRMAQGDEPRPKSAAELAEEERLLKRKHRARESRVAKLGSSSAPQHLTPAGPSHTLPRSKTIAPPNHAEQLARLQWKEAAPERTEAGERKKAEAHAAKVARAEEAKANAAKQALSEAQKAIAMASNPKAPVITVADVAGL